MIKQISEMHSIFLKYSGGYTASRSKFLHERTWYQLVKAGFTVEDVELYLSWITIQNLDREEKYRRKFSIPKMFGDVKKFESELNEAKAWDRNMASKPTNKEVTLRALRPLVNEEVTTDSAQPVKDIISRVLRRIQKDDQGTHKG